MITKQLKDLRGYSRSGYDVYHELTDGVRPALGDAAKPADWLPVLLKDDYNNEWWVILAGTIISLDRTISGVPRIVPAVGVAPMTITYGVSDVGYTVDADLPIGASKALVAGAGAASAPIPANKPVGWAWHHYYSAAIEERLVNYELQPWVSILCDYEVELALIDDITGVQNFESGCFVKPGVTGLRAGLPHLWVSGVDSAELICGRVIYRDTIPTGVNSRSRIDLEKPVAGFRLPGMETDGRPRHLDALILGSSTVRASDFVRVNLTCL